MRRRQVRHASITADEQQVCPVTTAKLGSMGDPLAVDVEGRKVWVCCSGCPDKLKAEPARYLATARTPGGACGRGAERARVGGDRYRQPQGGLR